MRLLGMGVSDLRDPSEIQKTLFDSEDRERQSRIDEMGDLAREMFGSQALRRGISMDRGSGEEQSGGE